MESRYILAGFFLDFLYLLTFIDALAGTRNTDPIVESIIHSYLCPNNMLLNSKHHLPFVVVCSPHLLRARVLQYHAQIVAQVKIKRPRLCRSGEPPDE